MTSNKIVITTGASRLETNWEARATTWGQLTKRLSQVTRTYESVSDYKAMTRTQKGKVKDKGGFVGGELVANGQRKASTVKNRTLVTLDIDYGRADTLGVIEDMMAGTAWCLYSTHSHTPEAPRYRLIVPLSRSVGPDEYVAIARRVADNVDIEIFDDSTYQPERLMYWPSCPTDGEFVFRTGEGDALDPDRVLDTYVDWKNVEEWPVSKRVQRLTRPNGHKQEDPTEKGGIIGAFCRCYSISEAIAAFLTDVYEPTGHPDRYTFIGGTTEAGLVVYDDKWAYSHHGTDPLCAKEANAFNLVRIHRFGSEDSETDPDTPVNRLPSFQKMSDFALADAKVGKMMAAQKMKEISDDFGDIDLEEDDNKWVSMLQMDDKKKNFLASSYNFELICRNDPGIKDTTKLDVFSGKKILTRDLPWASVTKEHKFWTDEDNEGLVCYISEHYRLQGKQAIVGAHDLVMSQSAFHPLRDYLSALRWDGEPRLDTLLVDYLGAADCELTRAMTRKHFTAAVARVMEPGIKYDYVLTLMGPEGVGKSTLVRKMGMRWFDDSFSSNDIGDKQAMEQVRGRWLIELGELTAYKKNIVDAFKAFVSKQVDEYRPAYGRESVKLPRQCVFFATTNESNFLKGDTGNRRFWPVGVYETGPKKDVFEMEQPEIDQIWAEALARYREGESLYLCRELEEQSRRRQEDFNEIAADERLGIIEAYLRTPLPSSWYSLTRDQRADWFKCNSRLEEGDGGIRREYICAMEVAKECFRKDVNRYEAKEINQLLKKLLGPSSYIGASRTKDAAYGIQKRFRIDPGAFVTTDSYVKVA